MTKLILWMVLVVFILIIAKCSHVIYSGFSNIPEYATEEVLTQQYGGLISDIDEQINNGKSLFNVAANLESVTYPENTVAVFLEQEDEDDIFIKGKNPKGTNSTFTVNGFGYGKLGMQDIVIIERSIDQFGLDDAVVYLAHIE